jgi:hypothetical protein
MAEKPPASCAQANGVFGKALRSRACPYSLKLNIRRASETEHYPAPFRNARRGNVERQPFVPKPCCSTGSRCGSCGRPQKPCRTRDPSGGYCVNCRPASGVAPKRTAAPCQGRYVVRWNAWPSRQQPQPRDRGLLSPPVPMPLSWCTEVSRGMVTRLDHIECWSATLRLDLPAQPHTTGCRHLIETTARPFLPHPRTGTAL